MHSQHYTAPHVILSSGRCPSVRLARNGQSDLDLIEEYQCFGLDGHGVVLSFSEITLRPYLAGEESSPPALIQPPSLARQRAA